MGPEVIPPGIREESDHVAADRPPLPGVCALAPLGRPSEGSSGRCAAVTALVGQDDRKEFEDFLWSFFA